MATIKGQNLRVLVSTGGASGTYKCIAMATNATLHVAAQVQDSSTKDDTGDWAANEITGLSWDVTTDSLVTLTDNGTNGELPQDLFSLILNKTKVTLMFDQTGSTNNRTPQNSAIKRTGEAYLQDLSVSAPNRQNSTISASFVGTGPIS